jgi:hypothetical protein
VASAKKKPEDERSPAQSLEAGSDEKLSGQPPPGPEPLVAPALGVSPAPLPAVLTPPPPAPPVEGRMVFRVWPYGTLQHNGRTYQPGDTLTLHEAEASKIPCLVKVDG